MKELNRNGLRIGHSFGGHNLFPILCTVILAYCVNLDDFMASVILFFLSIMNVIYFSKETFRNREKEEDDERI